MQPSATSTTPHTAWWHHTFMWLVVGAPAVVVVASVATLGIALRHADEPLPQSPTARDVARSTLAQRADSPAHQARNHAATPPVALPKAPQP